jgi:gamma-glutamyltranspeptidase/glutathione hydrolase
MRLWIILSAWLVFVSHGYAGQAAVAMPDRFSAQVAQQILDKGGNAVDAAVAASMVLAVTYPEAGNLGGGGFMLVRHQQHDYFLDYRETAPSKAHRDVYLNEQGEVIPRQSLIGVQAAGVPGTVAGLWEAHQRFGRLPWAELMKPAIILAEQGFEVPQDLANLASWYQGWLGNKATQVNFANYFGGLVTGKVIKQPELARTLTRIAKLGADDFYRGQTAKYLLAQVGSWFSAEDLANYRPRWREPLVGEWRG